MPRRAKELLWFVPILLFLWGLLFIRIDAPWYGLQEAPRSWIPAGVRNYNTYGLNQTGLMIVRDIGPTDPDNFTYYSHHPPLIIWIPAAITELTGFHEMGVRYGFIVISLLSCAAFYVLVRRLYGMRVAWWAALFYAITPMILYYGRVPGFNPGGMLVGFLFANVLINWLWQPNRPRLLALAALTVLAVWSAWPAVFYVAALGAAGLLYGSRSQRAAIVGFGALTIAAFGAMMLFYQLQWDGAFDSIMDAFVWRSSNANDDPGSAPFTVLEFLFTTLVHTGTFVTIGLLLLAAWGTVVLARRRFTFANVMTLALLVAAVGFQLVFRNGSYVHDYYKIVFVPVIAIAAAVVWVQTHRESAARFTRPIADSLMLLAVISGALTLFWLHRTGDRPFLTDVIAAIESETAPDDRLATHLFGKDTMMPLVFYTYRNIAERMTPADAQTEADATGQRVVYIFCPEQDTGAPGIPESYDTLPAGECQLVLIPPADSN